MTLEATGNPHHVPPSRGSGGGSRPGVHRRARKRRSSSEVDTGPAGSSYDHHLASVLASMPHNSRFATHSMAAPMADAIMSQSHLYPTVSAQSSTEHNPPFSIMSPAGNEFSLSPSLPVPTASSISTTQPMPLASPVPSPGALSPVSIPARGRSASTGSISPISSTLVPNVLSGSLSVPVSAPLVTSSSPTTPTTSNAILGSPLQNTFPISPLPNMPMPASPSGPTPSVVVSAEPATLLPDPADTLKAISSPPMDSMAAAAALSTMHSPTFPILPPATAANAPAVVPTASFSSIPTAEEAVLP